MFLDIPGIYGPLESSLADRVTEHQFRYRICSYEKIKVKFDLFVSIIIFVFAGITAKTLLYYLNLLDELSSVSALSLGTCNPVATAKLLSWTSFCSIVGAARLAPR